jgi:hypothetical protein
MLSAHYPLTGGKWQPASKLTGGSGNPPVTLLARNSRYFVLEQGWRNVSGLNQIINCRTKKLIKSYVFQKEQIRLKYSNVPRKLFQRIWNTMDSQWFAFHEIVSEYVKSILGHMENTSEANKRTWRIAPEHFAVFPYTSIDIKSNLSRQLIGKKTKRKDHR